jgi:hypothetical protein
MAVADADALDGIGNADFSEDVPPEECGLVHWRRFLRNKQKYLMASLNKRRQRTYLTK